MQHARDHGAQRTERQPVPRLHDGRQWPILGAHAEVAEPEQHGPKGLTRSSASDSRPARRTSIRRPLARCCPDRLAGSVAASLATTTSPRRSSPTKSVRALCTRPPAPVGDEQSGIRRTLRWNASPLSSGHLSSRFVRRPMPQERAGERVGDLTCGRFRSLERRRDPHRGPRPRAVVCPCLQGPARGRGCPPPASSSFQMRLRWWRPALLAP